MNETNFDWDDLRLFLAVARSGGLAAAAAGTGKSAPTLGRRMLALERRLGRELFHRMARGYALTEDGEDLLSQAVALENRIAPVINTDPMQSLPLVKLSAGAWVSYVLCNRSHDIIGQDPVRLRFIAADEVLDIGHREAIIGIRNHRPDDTRLAGRKIGRVQFAVYATDEKVASWARVLGTTPSARWVGDLPRTPGDLEVTHPRSALDLALAGAARAVLPTFIGSRFDMLKQVSPEILELEHDQWLVTHHEDRFQPEVRRVINRTYGVLQDVCAVT